MKRYIKILSVLLICIGSILYVSIYINTDRNPPYPKQKADTFFEPALTQLSPDFTKIAFVPSPVYYREGHPYSFTRYSDIYVYDIDTETIMQLLNNSRVSWLTWHNNQGSLELWISKRELLWELWPRGFLYQIVFDDTVQVNKSCVAPKVESQFSWNPDGTILVGKPKVLSFRRTFRDDIAVSFDKGRSAIYYEGIHFRRIFWQDASTFYVQDTETQSVFKFQAGSEKLEKLDSIIVFDEQKEIQLSGLIENKLVWLVGRYHIYIGDDVLYETENSIIGSVHVAESYVVFREQHEIVVLDFREGLINKQPIKDDFVILAIDSNKNDIYLMTNRNSIAVWNFSNGNGIEQILDISIILGSKS